jgi:predicted MFS family arabinose efflux permease
MSAAPAKSEWASGWPLVLTCAVGLSGPAIALYALGQFMAPLEQEFGWSRTEVSIGLSTSLIVGIVMSPIIGRIVDLTNARILALIGCVLAAIGMASLSLANGDIRLWIGLWLLRAVFGVLIGPVIWLSVLPGVFKRHRGMAIAVALAGQSLAPMLAPTFANYLISAYGWRLAFELLALIWYGAMFVLTLLFFFDRRERQPRPARAAAAPAEEDKASVWAVFRSPNFLKIAFVAFALKAISVGALVHLAPALVDKGFGAMQAAQIAGAAGLATVLGKLGVGWMFDRMSIFKVSAVVCAVFALAALWLVFLSVQVGWALGACVALGASDGAVLTATACLCGRLFAQREFGMVYGAMMSAMAISTAAGPTLASLAHDRYDSYAPFYLAGLGAAAICLLLLKTVQAPRVQPAVAAAE